MGIPVADWGQRINPDIELRKYTIIENMLIAGTQGISEAIFNDGAFTIQEDGETHFNVRLDSMRRNPSAQGLVEGFYFNAGPYITWEGLKKGRFYYLYIRATHNLPHNPQAIRVVSSKKRIHNHAVLLATVDLTAESPSIDTHPEGKIYTLDVTRHVNDNNNPHGMHLVQQDVTINGILRLSEDARIEFDGKDGFLNEVSQNHLERLEFESGGKEGVVMQCSGKVNHVDIQRIVKGDFSGNLGEIGIGYHGIDENIDSANEFAVYNDGEIGLPLRASIKIDV